MRKRVLAVAAALMVCAAPAVATAEIPTHLKAEYTSAYKEVRSLPAAYPAGCNLIEHRCADDRNPAASAVERSLGVLNNEIALYRAAQTAPPLVPVNANGGTQVQQSTAGTTTAASSSSSSVGGGFAQCVANRESSGNASYNDGTYHGLYNFDQQTWQAAGGGQYASSADGATPEQQTQVFERWYAQHPEAWPQTGPACSRRG